MLYIMVGLPYSGKTTLRHVLAKRFGFGVVSVDEIIAERWQKIERMSPADWNSVYQETYSRLKRLLADSRTVIFDSCNLYQHEREGARRVAENAGANFKLIYINTSPAEVRKKWLLNQETKERSSLEKDFFEMTIRIFEKPTPEENPLTYNPMEDLDDWIQKNVGKFTHDQDIRDFANRYNRFYPFYHPQKFFVREMIIKKVLEKNPGIDLSIKNKIVNGLAFLYSRSFNLKWGDNNFLANWFQDFIATTEGRRLDKIYRRHEGRIAQLSLLDAGCGPGNYFSGFMKDGLHNFFDYTGFDIAEKNIAESRRFYPSVRFEHGNILRLPFPSANFDVVLASRVLEYIPLENLRMALEELLRVAQKTIIINFLLEKDIPDHVEIELPHYCRNMLSRSKLREFFLARNCTVSITDIFRPLSGDKIEYIDRFGNPISLSSWVIEKSD